MRHARTSATAVVLGPGKVRRTHGGLLVLLVLLLVLVLAVVSVTVVVVVLVLVLVRLLLVHVLPVLLEFFVDHRLSHILKDLC